MYYLHDSLLYIFYKICIQNTNIGYWMLEGTAYIILL